MGADLRAEIPGDSPERADTELGLPRVVATTMAVNVGSRRVLEKVGMRHVDTFFANWPDPIPGAEHGDVVYAVTREEWLAGAGVVE